MAPMSLSDLFDNLEKQYPGMAAKVLRSCAVTVNLDYVDVQSESGKYILKAGDEVAIIPPVSSG